MLLNILFFKCFVCFVWYQSIDSDVLAYSSVDCILHSSIAPSSGFLSQFRRCTPDNPSKPWPVGSRRCSYDSNKVNGGGEHHIIRVDHLSASKRGHVHDGNVFFQDSLTTVGDSLSYIVERFTRQRSNVLVSNFIARVAVRYRSDIFG